MNLTEKQKAFATLVATMDRLLKCSHPELLVNATLHVCSECGAHRDGKKGKFTLPLRLEAVRIGVERMRDAKDVIEAEVESEDD